jgi:hypothetical protein
MHGTADANLSSPAGFLRVNILASPRRPGLRTIVVSSHPNGGDHDAHLPLSATVEQLLRTLETRFSNQCSIVLRAMHVADAKSQASGFAMNIQDAVVIARYDKEKKRIDIRGPIDGVPKSVIAHVLTHVLQDQHFGFKWR